VREFDIRAGNALMYYPEANVLVPTTTDPQSRTPAFKSVPVTIEVAGNVSSPAVLQEDASGRVALEMVAK
jgi:hypothetical protein